MQKKLVVKNPESQILSNDFPDMDVDDPIHTSKQRIEQGNIMLYPNSTELLDKQSMYVLFTKAKIEMQSQIET